jgi:uncharacterized protein
VTSGRLPLVDALRGFALFGVVVSNVAVFAGTGAAAVPESPLEQRVGLLVASLITGKFLALFALLFGLSFGLHLRRGAERDEPVAAPYLRRLGSLLLIGMAHRVLFGADILMTYAVLGVVLLVLRNASDRVLLLAAVLSLGLPELWRSLAEWIHYQPPPPVISRADRIRLATEGPYLELVRVRLVMLTGWWRQLLPELDNLALFLLGLWTARRGLLERLAEERLLLHAACWGGLVFAIGGNLAQVALRPAIASGAGSWAQATFGIVWNATTFVQAIFYGAGIALLWSWSGRARRLLAWLVPAGRMALTNYLAVSILVTSIVSFTGYYGRLTLAAAVGFGVLLWIAELAWSTWWLQEHRVGPAEWLWRTLTFGRLQPMRILRTKIQPA